MKKLRWIVLVAVVLVVMLIGVTSVWAEEAGPGTVSGGPDADYLPILPERASQPWPEGLEPIFAGFVLGGSANEPTTLCYPVPMNWGYLTIKAFDPDGGVDGTGAWVTLPMEFQPGGFVACVQVTSPYVEVALFGKYLGEPENKNILLFGGGGN